MANIGERVAYSVSEVAKLLGLSDKAIYKHIYAGHLKGVKLGSRVLIPAWALREFLDAREASQAQEAREK